MKRSRTVALVAAAVALVVGAVVLAIAYRPGRAPERAGVSPLSFFPAAARGVIHVPDVGRVGAGLASLQETRLAELAAMALGTRDPEEPIRAVVQQLGFDPRQPESMSEAGIDPARGLAFGEDDAGAQLLAVAVADPGRFARYADGLARRLGAVRSAEEPLPAPGTAAPGSPATGAAAGPPPAPAGDPAAGAATVFRSAGEPGRIVLAHVLRDGFAVVASDAGALEALGRAMARPAAASLAGSAAYATAREKLGPAQVYGLVADSRTLAGARRPRGPNPGPAAVGLTVAREGLGLRLLLPRSPAVAAVAPVERTPLDEGAPLLPNLPPETFVAARLGGEPSSVRAVVEALLPRGLSVRLSRAGIDLDRELLANLRAGPVLGIGLAERPDLSGGLPDADARISTYNPFRLVTVSLYARVRDPAAARAVLEKIAAEDERFAMEVSSREEAGEKVYTASYAAGEGMTWGLVGDVLVATGGADAFAAARARLGGAGPRWEAAEPAGREALARPGASIYLDLPKLAARVKAIPESAFGVGGFQIKDSLDGWADLFSEVKGATAVFAAEPEGLVLDVNVGLR